MVNATSAISPTMKNALSIAKIQPIAMKPPPDGEDRAVSLVAKLPRRA